MFFAPRMPSPLAGLKDLPPRVVIAKWGRNDSVNGPFTVGPKTAKLMPLVQKLLGFDTIALDFEHNTVAGTAAYKADKEPRNVAAHGVPRVIEGEGIVVDAVRWTPHGEKSVHEGLHPDLSPALRTDESGEVVFIHSAALCRQGAVPDLQLFSAESIFSAEQLAAFSAAIGPSPSVPHSLTPSLTPSKMDYKKLLCLMLGLDPATATDAEIEAASKARAGESADVKTFSASLKTLTERLGSLEVKLTASERAALISAATAAGKLVPHGAEIDKLDNTAFAAVLAALPADVVPLGQRTPDGLKTFTPSVTSGMADPSVSEVQRALRISPEVWAKHNK